MQQDDATTKKMSDAYAEYAVMLMDHCRFRTSSREEAEELVQDTFVNTHEYIRRGNKIENLKAFLFRVADNLIIDRARRRKNKIEKEISLDMLSESGFLPETKYGMEMVKKKMEAEGVLLALRDMTQSDRLLFELRYIDGLKPAEIAVITGLSSNAVSVRLHRLLKQLSGVLKEGPGVRE